MSETDNIARMAELVSENLLSFFKWEKKDLYNTNFDCKKPKEHSNKDNHSHPVDVVFHYLDPYTGQRVILNTDLKSYAAGSINVSKVRTAIKSLAKTIDCARLSKEWGDRFKQFEEPVDIRALLFVYNHTGRFDNSFYSKFFTKKREEKKQIIDPASIPLKKNMLLHIIEPLQIRYLNTIKNDLNALVAKRKFPMLDDEKHWFFYPDLYLHKTHFNKYERAASIEMLASPYLIIGHDEVLKPEGEVASKKGYIIYYKDRGETVDEFVYLLDTLSKNQLLDSSAPIKIRCAGYDLHPDITTNFKNAIARYSSSWGFDVHKKQRLDEIESDFNTVTQVKELLSDINVGWRS